MRIDTLRLINFRVFERFELRLEPTLTVLVGRNGAGKTTVLEGLAVALGAWVSGFSGIREDYPIPKSSARRVTAKTSTDLPTESTSYPVRVEAEGQLRDAAGGDARIAWARELRSVEGRTTSGEAVSLRDRAEATEQQLSSSTPTVLPVVAYYGTGRLWLHKREKRTEKRHLKSRLEGYHAALEAASDHKGFEAWMAWREEDRVQRLARAADEGRLLTEVRSPELEAVSTAASGCLEGAQRIYFSANHQELRVDFDNGTSIPFDALSDGQRNLIAVAADIAWRATQLNPHLGAAAPSEATGVVLIDEVDLHLHPAWQWRVLEDLTRTFPRIQFVVTTHSPQVMSSAPAGSVLQLDAEHQPLSGTGTTGNEADTDPLIRHDHPTGSPRALASAAA
ncbi:AAA family ATPase [Chondromyces crocatus]|uniref:ATP-binding protein n=1 Tax=Chondromyces crocatus TaxID=52 RepID=A0A0K1ELJ4_CHOCO|nr:AAA family ATPase [Chondromyces crocatus]AKT41671.1 ATP-binding protein [Chondromyces crocatus]